MEPRYFLRTTPGNGISGGQILDNSEERAPTIVWPVEIGTEVACVDWDPEPVCGFGIHGYLNGQGHGAQLLSNPSAIWQVVEIPEGVEIVHITGDNDDKCKAARVILRFSGNKEDAIAWLVEHAPGYAVYGARIMAGNNRVVVGGYESKVVAGENGKATAGDYGCAEVGIHGTAIAGHHGRAFAGRHGTAIAGQYGMASVAEWGTAIAGVGGCVYAGDYGKAKTGKNGRIQIEYYIEDKIAPRVAVGYVGEDGIEADVFYKVGSAGKLTKAESDNV